MAGQTEKGNATVLLVIRGILILVLNMIFYVVIVFATVEVCKFTYSFANEVFGEVMAEAPPGQDKVFVIQKAEDSLTIAKKSGTGGHRAQCLFLLYPAKTVTE